MFKWTSVEEWRKLWRYYQVGVVNTVFGYTVFAALIKLGVNIYVAQIISHIVGATFNYITYSRYVFAGNKSSLLSYALAYIFNYATSAIVLLLTHHMLSSPYLCGMIATVVASIINYFALKIVFRWKASDE